MQIVYPVEGKPLKEPKSLEQFLEKCRAVLLEKLIYAKAECDDTIYSEEIPPLIAPVLRGASLYNTEHEKKSVYLKSNQFAGNI